MFVLSLRGLSFLGFASDVWSIGVILFVLLSGQQPFAAEDEEVEAQLVLRGRWTFGAATWRDVSSSAKGLVRAMLTGDPARRPTASEALQHAWFTAPEPPLEPPLPPFGGCRAATAGAASYRSWLSPLPPQPFDPQAPAASRASVQRRAAREPLRNGRLGGGSGRREAASSADLVALHRRRAAAAHPPPGSRSVELLHLELEREAKREEAAEEAAEGEADGQAAAEAAAEAEAEAEAEARGSGAAAALLSGRAVRRSAVASVRPLRKSQELAPALALLASAHRSASPRAGSCAALPASVSMPETMWLERRPALQPLPQPRGRHRSSALEHIRL